LHAPFFPSVAAAFDFFRRTNFYSEMFQTLAERIPELWAGDFEAEILQVWQSFLLTPCMVEALPAVFRPHYAEVFKPRLKTPIKGRYAASNHALRQASWSVQERHMVHLQRYVSIYVRMYVNV
jgi:hypothetical protein